MIDAWTVTYVFMPTAYCFAGVACGLFIGMLLWRPRAPKDIREVARTLRSKR